VLRTPSAHLWTKLSLPVIGAGTFLNKYRIKSEKAIHISSLDESNGRSQIRKEAAASAMLTALLRRTKVSGLILFD